MNSSETNVNVNPYIKFQDTVTALTYSRRLGIQYHARDFVRDEVGGEVTANIYAIMGAHQKTLSKAEVYRKEGDELMDQAIDLLFKGSNSYGELLSVSKERVVIKPTRHLRDLIDKLQYARSCPRHPKSILLPMGCMQWSLLLTEVNGEFVFDNYRNTKVMAKAILIKRGVLEQLRRVIRSNNQFEPLLTGKETMALKLTKSGLTLGMLDLLHDNLLKAIEERFVGIYRMLFSDEEHHGNWSIEPTGTRWDREWKIYHHTNSGKELIARIRLIDKTFFVEF